MYVFYMDLKAFDRCDHEQLRKSLVRKDINPVDKFLKVLRSMYSQSKSCVKVNGKLTDFFSCNIGTKQGCMSSTTIFAQFINDINTYM